jgi:hypothetical protein
MIELQIKALLMEEIVHNLQEELLYVDLILHSKHYLVIQTLLLLDLVFVDVFLVLVVEAIHF